MGIPSDITTFYHVISWLTLFGYWLLIAGVTIRVLMKRRSVPSVTAWLLVIYILPLVGVIAYLLFGEQHLGKYRAQRAKAVWPSTAEWFNHLKERDIIFASRVSDVAQPLFQLCEHRNGMAGIKGNLLQLHVTAEETLTSLIADIEQSRENIEMVFYIWQPGGLVEEVTHSLIAARKRGVRCRIMLDSAGSHAFFRSREPQRLRDAGIEVVEALQVNLLRFFLRRMDLRQHRKVVLIDNHIAYTGSLNMVDPRFFKQDAGVGQWVDLMVRMQGPITSVLGVLYACDWEIETGQRHLPPAPPEDLCLPFPGEEGHTLQVIASGPGFPDEMIHQALLTAVYSARHQLIMTTPYFVPSDDLLHAICTAALRGVDVSIILPLRNDSLMVRWASRSFFMELLQAGVKIYQFKEGLLHTKSVLVDGQLSLIGTVNLDMRSLWLNFEITMVIDDQQLGDALAEIQQDYLKQSTLLDKQAWSIRPLWQRIVERLFYFFSPLL